MHCRCCRDYLTAHGWFVFCPMIGMNSREMAKAMRRFGLQQQEIDAQEVIIRCADKEIIIMNPQVAKVNVMGQETYQVVGAAREQPRATTVSPEDVQAVIAQTGADEATARQALAKHQGDLAKAILDLQNTSRI